MITREIANRDQKIRYLDRIVDYKRGGFSTAQIISGLTYWLIDMPVLWAKVDLDRALTKDDAAAWEAAYGSWDHSGREHAQLGMAFAWHLSQQPHIRDVELWDAPDIHARMVLPTEQHLATIVGDIGVCSVSALFDGLQTLEENDMWISVGPNGTHIALIFGYDIGRAMAESTSHTAS